MVGGLGKMAVAGALAAVCAVGMSWGKAKEADPLQEAEALARQIDRDAGEGRLVVETASYTDPKLSLSERRLWRDGSGIPRKYHVEHSASGQELSVDYYYGPAGELRYMVHTSGRTVPDESRIAAEWEEEIYQQNIVLDGKGRVVSVLFRRALSRDGVEAEPEMTGNLPWPDETLWPVPLIADPSADFRQAASVLSPRKPAVIPPPPVLSAKDLRARLSRERDLQLVDVRTAQEFAQGHVAGARLIPLGELPGRWKELDRSKALVFYCHSGKRSAEALALVRDRGFTRATHLAGGIQAWLAAGYPVER